MTETLRVESSAKDNTQEIRWLWKANKETCFYQYANDYGTRIGIALVTLNSAQPLNYDQVKQAFQVVQRKCLNLRIALQNRGNDLWFCEMPDADVDFEVLDENSNFFEAMEKSRKENFNCTNKPHWRVRIIPRSVDTPCAIQEVKNSFPYQYDYFIQPNHILLDGMNIALVIHMAHKILDDIISGKSFLDMDPYDDFTEHDGLEEMEDMIKKLFHENPRHLATLASECPCPMRSLWLTKVYPRPEVAKPATNHISRLIDSDILRQLKDKSKKAGVTFNSVFVAIINAAFVDLMVEGGIVENTYKLQACHVVNLRRYLEKQETIALGPYQCSMSHASEVRVSVKENFWEYVKDYNKDLQSKIKSSTPLKQKVFKKLQQPPASPKEYFKNPPSVVHDFSVSNIGDLTPIVPGIGIHVQVTDMQPFNIIHSHIHMNLHQIATYREHSRYTLSYDTSYMNDETATRVAEKVFCLLQEITSG